ncbi:MAG: regulatory protein RecX [Micropruina sp.]
MAKRRVPDEATHEVLDRLTEVGLIDDKRFAAAVFDAQQRRQRSTRALRQELRTKGIDAELIERAAADVDSETDLAVARDLVAKRARSLERFPYQVRYRRLAGQLARRGFSTEVIATVLRELPGDGAEEASDAP